MKQKPMMIDYSIDRAEENKLAVYRAITELMISRKNRFNAALDLMLETAEDRKEIEEDTPTVFVLVEDNE